MKMMNIQKKALANVSKILGSFDTYPVYYATMEAMRKAGIDTLVINEIMSKYGEAIQKEIAKVQEAKEWVDSMLLDLQ